MDDNKRSDRMYDGLNNNENNDNNDDRRRNNYILVGLLALALIATAVFGVNQRRIKGEYKTALNNDYQRLFYDTKAHINNVEVSLSKAVLSDSKEQNIIYLSNVMQQSQSAQEKLSQMPVNHSDINKTTKYLTQVSDYCYSLIKSHLEGKDITKEQRDSLKELGKYSTYLAGEMSNLHNKFMKGDLNFDIVRHNEKRELKKANENMLNTSLVKLEEEMTKYPELIYDGPFSDQARKIKAKGLGTKKVTEKEAKKKAETFIGTKKVGKITKFESGKDLDNEATIPSYTFSVAPKNKEKEQTTYISVSKTGGNIVWMSNPRSVSKASLSMEDAHKRAKQFLEEKGFKNMELNYSLNNHNIATLNFAYTVDNVTIYPDLIKVKVALDNGEIVGFDALHYLKEHHERNIQKPTITLEQAREKVRFDFDITSTRLAIIPKGMKDEVLCYEFKGNYEGDNFIVYINANTAQEEQILRVIKDENGTLTF